MSFIRSRSDRLDLEEVRRSGHVEWNARCNDDAIAGTRETSLDDRLPRSLHAALRAEAGAENISLNQLIVAKLSMPATDASTSTLLPGCERER